MEHWYYHIFPVLRAHPFKVCVLSECVRSHGQELHSFAGKKVQIHTAGWHKLGRLQSYKEFPELVAIARVHSYQSQCNSKHEYTETQVGSALGFRVVWSF